MVKELKSKLELMFSWYEFSENKELLRCVFTTYVAIAELNKDEIEKYLNELYINSCVEECDVTFPEFKEFMTEFINLI